MPTETGLQRRQHLQQAWTAPDAFATTLLLLFIDQYDSTAIQDWSDACIKMEIEDDFNVKLPQGNFDRLMVAKDLLTTDNFYTSLPDFIQWCNVLNGDTYDPRSWDPADAQEIAWGISEAMIIEPPEWEEPFSPEVRAYIGAVLDMEGIVKAPDILRLALRNADLETQVHGEFSDDPDMFRAIWQFEESKTSGVNQYVREQVTKLASQLESLPLRTGNTKGIVQKVLQALS